VGNNFEKTHEVKLEHFSTLSSTTWKNDWRCGQQQGKMFGIVGNNEEELQQHIFW
jgi:hypothetical protein